MLPLLIQLIVILVVFGAIFYIVKLLPLDATLKQIVYILLLLVAVLMLLQLLLGGGLGILRLGP
jgi:hypothetical protein